MIEAADGFGGALYLMVEGLAAMGIQDSVGALMD